MRSAEIFTVDRSQGNQHWRDYCVIVYAKRGHKVGERTFSRHLGEAVLWAKSFAPRPENMVITVDGSPLKYDQYGHPVEPWYGRFNPEDL